MPVVLALGLVLVLSGFIYANRRFVAAVRDRHGWVPPGERYIERGDVPLPSPGEFTWMAGIVLKRNSDPVVERWRRWNIVLALSWVLVGATFGISVLWST